MPTDDIAVGDLVTYWHDSPHREFTLGLVLSVRDTESFGTSARVMWLVPASWWEGTTEGDVESESVVYLRRLRSSAVR